MCMHIHIHVRIYKEVYFKELAPVVVGPGKPVYCRAGPDAGNSDRIPVL